MSQNKIRTLLGENPIIPVVKFEDLSEVIPLIDYLQENNYNCVEITLRTECSIDAIKLAKQYCNDSFLIGAGSVINSGQIRVLVDAEIDFVVLPGIQENLIDVLNQLNVPFLPGVMTPSDIMKALNLGWDTLKFFPANVAGGIGAIKTYGQLFPHVKFCPTGGISYDNHLEFLALENVISVGGSWIQKNFKN